MKLYGYKVMYQGTPMAVHLDYSTGKFWIYDKEKKDYGRSYSSYSAAEKHAKGWNRAYKRR